jgi:hypothetical protein
MKISNGGWVNGGYSMKSTVTGALTVVRNKANVCGASWSAAKTFDP